MPNVAQGVVGTQLLEFVSRMSISGEAVHRHDRDGVSPSGRPARVFWRALTGFCCLAIGAGALVGSAAADAPPAAKDVEVILAPRKIDLPLLTEPLVETPQTITLIPEKVIALSGLGDLRDVLRFAPSVSPHADEDSGQGTNVQIRGFSAKNDLYRDGQLDLGRYYRDPFDIETVEVLTGPSSVMFGRGSTGGAVNEVSKRPNLDGRRSTALSVGDDGLARVTVDLDAPLSATSALRFNGVLHESETAGRNEVFAKRSGVSPVISFGLGGRTEVTVGMLHQSERDRPDYGVPWIDIGKPGGTPGGDVSHPAHVPWSNYYGFKDDAAQADANIATASVKTRLDAVWSFKDQLRYGWYSRSFRATEPGVGPIIAPGTELSTLSVSRTVRGVSSDESLLENQADFSGKFELWGATHKLVIGGEVGRQTSDPTTFKYTGVPGTNLIHPDPTPAFTGIVTPKSIVRFSADTAGAYVGDTIEVGRFEAEGVARIDRFAARYANTVPTVTELDHTDVEASYRAALVYKPARAGRLYLMWGTSFDPSAEGLSLSATTADLAPLRTQTLEAGVKWDFHRSFLLSAALFRTVESNYREASQLDPTLTTIVGTARAQGAELLAQGQITPQWFVLGGYTYLDAKILSSPNLDAGQPSQNAPRHSLRLFTSYDVAANLTVGGGVNVSSSRVPNSSPDPNNFRQSVPGYAVVSALARYQLTPNADLQLNAQNLFNAHFYDGLDDNHVNVGAGRSVHVTLQVRN